MANVWKSPHVTYTSRSTHCIHGAHRHGSFLYILFLKKEGNTTIHSSMDETWSHCAKWNKAGTHRRTDTARPHLHTALETVQLTEQSVDGRCWRQGKSRLGSYCYARWIALEIYCVTLCLPVILYCLLKICIIFKKCYKRVDFMLSVLITVFFFFYSTGVWTQGPVLVWQVLYPSSHTLRPFF
jgi:hypothetical protein